MKNNELIKVLVDNKDLKYKNFNDKIVNTNLLTIGVRTPILKRIAKDISKDNYAEFLKNNKCNYFEEVMIEGFVISYIKEPLETLKRLDKFLDKIDNWAVCDMVISSCKKLQMVKDDYFLVIKKNLLSNNVWRVRFSFVSLLNYFIEEKYLKDIFDFLDNDKNDFYYVMMSKAWLISVCYVKYPRKTLTYLKRAKIDDITYNKAISKICDSKRVNKEDKIILKAMKKNKEKA